MRLIVIESFSLVDVVVSFVACRGAHSYRHDETEELHEDEHDTEGNQIRQISVYVGENGLVATRLIVLVGRCFLWHQTRSLSRDIAIIIWRVTTATLEHGLYGVHDRHGDLVVVFVDGLDGLVETELEFGTRLTLIGDNDGRGRHLQDEHHGDDEAISGQEALVLLHRAKYANKANENAYYARYDEQQASTV